MGNASSIAELPTEWESILPHITRDDIVSSSRKKCRVDEIKKSHVYLDDDLFDLDEHVPMALAILRAHPHLKDVRFKLVPGKMTEENYWAALFGILRDGGIDIEDMAGKIDNDYEMGDEVDDSGEEIEVADEYMAQTPIEQSRKTTDGKLVRTPIAKLEQAYYDDGDVLESNADATNTHPFYLDEIKQQQSHIARLQKSLREANHKTRKLALELHKERKKAEAIMEAGGDGANNNPAIIPSCSRCNSALLNQKVHSGTWDMHPDCNEFMQLDDHLKENLRQEKEKRLGEVLSQMKFILDTDDIKDSYGSWSCCGEEKYEADGCID